ncbi:alpha-L-fucosidase [Novipirellula artificiosorum]|uniref:alpha-L-fucosidase n=1 Tax=Novipirellula artificiosorum TaxID=2528016 RepID=A0A5C6E5K0_9BACT|nr:alpha-L-fucosidase [Novipirellula artificiosorum]TWU42429.1 Alpha-L-fucosidase [Novipirellula artificiosorum]
MMTRKFSRLLGLLLATLLLAQSTPNGFAQVRSESQQGDRMDWWRNDRFGMFIHWGLYAVPAGEYQGNDVKGIGEWIMDKANIPREEYEKYASQFDPQSFDADEWVRIAKYAGMKYIVITSKHHDGFCLFDSQTDYDIVDATPYKKDLLKPLSEACERHGLKFCTYYSIMDWHHDSQLPSSENDGKPKWNPTRMVEGQKQAYTDYMKEHLRKLIVDYNTHVLWFDGEWPSWWTDADGKSLYQWLLALNPNLIVNNRVGAGRKGMGGFSKEDSFAGDFGTPEQEIPATGVDSDWESCMTMNDTWGFKASDENWKSSETLIRNLIDIASKGGNYLLNVGPKADGTFPQASVDRLRAIGDWMSVNGESLYGSEAALFRPEWGRVTRRGGTLYLHVFEWPAHGKLTLPALRNPIRRASLLATPETTLSVNQGNEQWVIDVPESAIDPIATVITIDVQGMPELALTRR